MISYGTMQLSLNRYIMNPNNINITYIINFDLSPNNNSNKIAKDLWTEIIFSSEYYNQETI